MTSTMYVPAWPGLEPRDLWRRAAERPPYPLGAAHCAHFFRARNAIFHLFRTLDLGAGASVLAPNYHSGNEVEAIRAAGLHVRFYPIDRHLEPDLDAIRRLCCRAARPRALLAIHFLGWPQPIVELSAMCREYGLVLIEDCALALLSESDGRPLGSFGDYAVFCLYKTLPLPNGGILVQNRHVIPELDCVSLQPCGLLSVGGRTCELLIERARARRRLIGHAAMTLKRAIGRWLTTAHINRTPIGEIGFDPGTVSLAMSRLARRLLNRFDYDTIRRTRIENFLALGKRLDGLATPLDRPLEPGVCPLFFPLLVKDKAAAAAALREQGIGALEFWNAGAAPEDDDVAFLRRHLIGLPIHQDVTPDQIQYVAERVLRLRLSVSQSRLPLISSGSRRRLAF